MSSSGERDKEKFILERSKEEDVIDTAFGYARINDTNQNEKRCGYLFNMKPVCAVICFVSQQSSYTNKETARLESAVDYYFIQQDGTTFRATRPMHPYFYIGVKQGAFREVENYLRRRFQEYIADVVKEEKIDLGQKNHLSGITRPYMRLDFFTVQDLLKVRGDIQPLVTKNKNAELEKEDGNDGKKYFIFYHYLHIRESSDAASNIVDIREYDVTYYTRCSIDQKTRCGEWYDVHVKSGEVTLEWRKDLGGTAPPFKVLAFDIECTKKPLKFPDPDAGDEVMMISYMVNDQGYLIVSREHVGEDIADFEYTPRPEYPGPFKVFNEPNERALMNRFISEIKRIKPHIFVTYNGDFFDWPFIDKRAKHLGISLRSAIGLYHSTEGKGDGETVYTLHYGPHLDAYKWVQRDSYLPHGSQGLKEVTKLKLHYNPLEVNPEEMVEKAKNDPQVMSSYSVSDAVATFYLYKKYVEPFIFSLCTIIPMNPDDVLRKGTGTLCETLLMVKAQSAKIIFPNKHSGRDDKFYKGHLLESETYVGGHVEALVSGVFRSDLDIRFDVSPEKVTSLISEVDDIIKFCVETEGGTKVENIVNYDDVKDAIIKQLMHLRDTPQRLEKPLIYHVDVASMYPNIILTNRLQPTAIVDDTTCAACIFNRPENNCKRKMEWKWCIDYLPNNKGEYAYVKECLETETFAHHDEKTGETRQLPYYKLAPSVQSQKLRSRLKEFCKKTYKKSHIVETLEKRDTVCMRENPFYVDTVRDFRDRRVELKNLWKGALKDLDVAKKSNAPSSTVEKAERMVVYYESLQLAHKCILNSFYGYVVRKGARWYSMEMAGIVTHTGSAIIKRTRETVELIGQPLELDTDGIWAAIPSSWPDNFNLKTTENRTITMSFLCTLLNREMHLEFTNHQYQDLVDPEKLDYDMRSECTIFFEVDGPYKAMVIPKSTEEEKQLKKRYVVFQDNGSIAELKGFEIKRRGELKLIKNFQKQVFAKYLSGSSLQECYEATATVANHFIDILERRGEFMDDEELLELISESRSMSRKLSDYKQAKSMTVTTANRLGELLGAETVKDAGVNCSWIVSRLPLDAPVTQRAVPIIIFNADPTTKKKLLSKWLKVGANTHISLALRDIVDWDYYTLRLSTTIQKMVTLPAFLQGVENPVKRVKHPEWILRRKREQDDKFKQRDIMTMMQQMSSKNATKVFDIEDLGREIMGDVTPKKKQGSVAAASLAGKGKKRAREDDDADMGEDELETAKKNLGPQPDQEKDYEGWLAWQKARWSLQKLERKRRRLVYGANVQRSKTGMNIDSFFQKKQMQFKEHPWQILQICPSGTPGIVTVWALSADGDMASMKLKMKRKFFINCFTEKENPLGQKTLALLPRQRQRHILYECECDEDVFVSNSREIAMQRVDPSVEGFYESKVPLEFRAICELGCVCSVVPSAKSHNTSMPWDLSQLERRSATSDYLKTTPRFIYMYMSRTADSQFGTFGLYFSALSEAQLVFYTSYTQQTVSQVKQAFAQGNPNGNIEVKSTLKFIFSEAVHIIQERLEKYKAEHPGSTILVLQTCLSKTEVASMLPVINDFPHMHLQFRKKDNQYPPFGWAQHTAHLFGRMTCHIGPHLERNIEIARYGNVPLCNLEDEANIFVSDVMYSRLLKHSGHVLWYSETSKPDLGGNEDVAWEEMTNPVACNPTVTKTLALEIDITGLAISTLLQSGQIEGMENLLHDAGTTQGKLKMDESKKEKVNSDFVVDEMSACQSAARVLSRLISKWSGDLFVNNEPNLAAHALWSTFYRWISSSQSRFYDPALHKLVHKMITKVFYTLMSEIKKLGVSVIYADFNRMIISTEKVTRTDCEAHFKFVNKTLRKHPLFHFVTFKAKTFWEVLLFKDPENFIGMISDNNGAKPKANWSLVNFLPEGIQNLFLLSLVNYIKRLHNIRPKTLLDVRPKNQDGEENNEEEDMRGTTVYRLDQQLSALREKQLSNEEKDLLREMKTTLLETTEKAMLAVGGDVNESELMKLLSTDYPAYKQSKNYALEFVKHVCYALSLNKDHEMEIEAMKSSMLKLVNSREFSAESDFVDPGISYLLPDIICDYCNHCRDIDLLRDRKLLKHDWSCEECSHTINSREVENRLIDIARNRVVSYQCQDLSCVKCGTVKKSNTLLICPQCSGHFTNRDPSASASRALSILLLIAKFHHFHFLQETVETALQYAK